MRIEQLTVEEGRRLRTIRLRALQDSPDAFGATFEETNARPDEKWSQQVRDLPTFVAVHDDVDVGMVRCARDSIDVRSASLISMWVAPEFRRKRFVTVLVNAFIGWARAARIERLVLDVADDNTAAIALYAHHGFEPNGKRSTWPRPRDYIHTHQRELQIMPGRA